ncbi:hypothetical protein LCGC14_1114940 [marine sediment metagenome]|uniref:Uncharacterized protein n=1 Tax=marine sediment metagenome TaxID=412755 RepID=A0A0F9MAD9_9ZZZZ
MAERPGNRSRSSVRAETRDEEDHIQTIKLFESAHLGFGDAQEVANFRYNRVHGSIDARWPGQVRAGLQIRSIANANWDRVPVFAHQWQDTASVPNVMIYIVVQDELWGLRFGALTQTSTGNIFGANATDAMMHNDGSGVPLIYIGFGDSGSEQSIRSTTAFTPGGDPTTATAAGTLRARLLFSLNGRAYRTLQPSGGQQACQVSTLPIGSDPITLANWGAAQTVGFASTRVNALTSVRHLPIAVKPEGIFMYNEGLDRWVNMTPGWKDAMHLRNGIGAHSLGNQAVIPMGDGGTMLFDGWNLVPFDPIGFDAAPNAHTTVGELNATANLKYWVVGVTGDSGDVGTGGGMENVKEIGAGSDLRVFHFNNTGSTFTDISSNMRDFDLTSTSAITMNESTDVLWIGWIRPFSAVNIRITGSGNSNAATVTAQVGQSGGGYTGVTVRDFTDVAGASLGRQDKIVMTEDPVGVRNWVQTTVNSVTLYWLRLNWNTGLSGAITLTTLHIQPWYPSVDDTNFPLDGLDKSGNFPHILLGTKDRQEANLWHDMGGLPEPDDIGAVLYTDVGGTSINRSRNLTLIGRYRIWTMDLTAGDHPGTEAHPFINDVGLIESTSMIPVPGKLCRLVRIRINGQEADPALLARFYYTWDYGNPWSKASTVQRFPADFEINQQSKGYRFRWAWGWSQSAVTALLTQPALTEIEGDFEVLPDDLDVTQERPLTSTPRF